MRRFREDKSSAESEEELGQTRNRRIAGKNQKGLDQASFRRLEDQSLNSVFCHRAVRERSCKGDSSRGEEELGEGRIEERALYPMGIFHRSLDWSSVSLLPAV